MNTRNLGIKNIKLNDEQLGQLYSNPTDNSVTLCTVNQYLIVETPTGEEVGPFLWDGEKFEQIYFKEFSSRMFGRVKPKDGDLYQMAYIDSLARNQLTFATGPAGSGKSLIALAYAFQEFEKGRVSKIVVFCNPYVADSAVKMGFYPGTKIDKLLETSIGSILISKIGSEDEVRKMIDEEELILMSMSDCRGYEVPENAFVYFTEAQNTNRYLMKLFLQRTNDTCKICVEGDERQQDSEKYHNGLNGFIRAIEVFQGEDYAGHVQLKHIYRGRIAARAELITEN